MKNILLVGMNNGKNWWTFWENVNEDDIESLLNISDDVDGILLLDDGYEFIYGNESENEMKRIMECNHLGNLVFDNMVKFSDLKLENLMADF